MFKLTCGDSWVEELPSLNEDGSINLGAACFIMSYIVMAVWTILQVDEANVDCQNAPIDSSCDHCGVLRVDGLRVSS